MNNPSLKLTMSEPAPLQSSLPGKWHHCSTCGPRPTSPLRSTQDLTTSLHHLPTLSGLCPQLLARSTGSDPHRLIPNPCPHPLFPLPLHSGQLDPLVSSSKSSTRLSQDLWYLLFFCREHPASDSQRAPCSLPSGLHSNRTHWRGPLTS